MATTPTPEEFLARARALSAKLSARAEHAEAIRRMPDETVKDFIDAQFYRIMQPKKYGGCEYGWEVWCDCLVELARGDGSQAWAMMVHCEYVQMLQGFSHRVQQDIWTDNPAALVSSSLQPVGKVEVVEGGYTLQTVGPKWGFSSGCDEASWFLIGGIIPGKGWSFFVVPRSAVTIHDDWHVMGLRASGSKSLTIDTPVFVPDYRTASDVELTNGVGPGATADAAAIAHWPRKVGAAFGYAAVPLGCAIRMLEEFEAATRARLAGRPRLPSEQQTAIRIAESAAEISAAQRLMRDTLREHGAIIAAGKKLTTQQRANARRDSAYIALLAQRASQRLLTAAGPSGLGESNALQRCFRDINAGANHMGLSWDSAATNYGDFALGYESIPGSF